MKDMKDEKEKAWEELRAKYDYSMPGSKKGYKKGFFGGFDAGVKAERERLNLKWRNMSMLRRMWSWSDVFRYMFPEEKEGGENAI